MKENNVKPYGYWNDKNHCLEEAKNTKINLNCNANVMAVIVVQLEMVG